jgi:WD40 repeat protein
MLTGSLDTTIKLWDPVNFKLLRTFEGHSQMVTNIIELNDGDIISSSLDKSILVWNRQNGEILNSIEDFKKRIIDIKLLNN